MLKSVSAALLATAVFAAPASAATVMTITPTPNPCDGLSCSFAVAGSTTDRTFSVTQGFNLPRQGTIASSLINVRINATTNIDFTSIRITDSLGTVTPFLLGRNGGLDYGVLSNMAVAPGDYLLTVAGRSGGNASFGGNISFAGVPEASTWALLIAGFGVTGFAMRRRNTKAHATRVRLNFI